MTTDYRVKTLPGTIPVVTEIFITGKRLKSPRVPPIKDFLSESPQIASNPKT
jgi:hypothetical protein